jgi:glycosyltransferase involved in cell wall biosynthesis
MRKSILGNGASLARRGSTVRRGSPRPQSAHDVIVRLLLGNPRAQKAMRFGPAQTVLARYGAGYRQNESGGVPQGDPLTNTAPVSVVIPCYNCRETIGRAMRSVALQTLLPEDIILVDDASTDDTLSLVRNLAFSYAPGRVRIIEVTKNKGPGSARNIGWEAAKSPFIAFLDADDAWHPRKIEIQYRWMRDNPNVSLTGHLLAWEGEKAEWPSLARVYTTKATRNQLLFFSPIRTQTIMVRRDEPLRFAEGQRFSEDHFLLVNMACSERNIVLLHAALARIHKANFGAGGLSGNLWAMERDQLKNYVGLLRNRKIGAALFAFAVTWSLAKYFRRVALTCLWAVTTGG